ncbi:hypothetical protein VTL71DRAFT_7746 [Oculimacula yallundae]|uniref:Uncharacterized protein n=1 Tax=Oculimacula yallundae TaxID=86028 RepID=A0ABR4CVJ9_9HELO
MQATLNQEIHTPNYSLMRRRLDDYGILEKYVKDGSETTSLNRTVGATNSAKEELKSALENTTPTTQKYAESTIEHLRKVKEAADGLSSIAQVRALNEGLARMCSLV